MSAGVLVAVAWLHLLDDAQERLEGLTMYPAANAAMLTGYLMMATVQELTWPCHHVPSVAGLPLLSKGSVAELGSPQLLHTFHVLEASISIHSVLIGLGFGLGELGAQEQFVLGLALSVHQCLEGLAIGLLGMKSGLRRSAWRRTYLVFTLSLPLGVAIGFAARQVYAGLAHDLTFRWSSGLMNGLAAGTLTHISMHMVSAHADEPRPPALIHDLNCRSLTAGQQCWPAGRDEKGMTDCCTQDRMLAMGRSNLTEGLMGRSNLTESTQDRMLAIMLDSCDAKRIPPSPWPSLPARCIPSLPVLRMMSAGVGAALMALLAIWA
jgi:zinc transporter 1/2/3